MRRLPLLGLVAALTVALTAFSVQSATVLGRGLRPAPQAVRVPGCPQAPASVDITPVHLVADLDHLAVRDSPATAGVLAAANQVVAGTIPPVRFGSPTDGGDPVRYLYDEGVALRRIAGVLGMAYAATKDPRYLDALAAQTVGASRWPDWNPGHALDTAQVGTAVALGLAWSGDRMTPGERAEVSGALVGRLLAPYTCSVGNPLATRRGGTGNQVTVVGTAAVLAGLAVHATAPAWSAAAVRAGAESLARSAAPDGSGRSLADGPTVEGLMYTTYEAANIALLQATVQANPHDQAVTVPLAGALPSLDALAAWNERCGKVADPNVQDGADVYPWIDRATALAAMTASPQAGPHLAALVDGLQAVDRLTVPPATTSLLVPDGIAELVRSQVGTPGSAAVATAQSWVAGGSPAAPLYGCTTSGDTYALLTGLPNDAPHAHADVGNVVVKQGEQTVLADLGQRMYTFAGGPVWRSATTAHSTVGVLQPDATARQSPVGSGAVTVEGAGLVMTSTTALPGVASWQRRVVPGPGTVSVHDTFSALDGSTVPLSTSFLVEAPLAAVVPQPDGSLQLTVADGSVWQLVPPPGATVSFSDASPSKPYVDAPDIASLAATHTLVVMRSDLAGTLDQTTVLQRVG